MCRMFFVLATLELHWRVVRGARRQRVRCGTGFSVRKILLRGRSSSHNIVYIYIYIYSPRHVSLDRTDPQFPSRGTVENRLCLSRTCCPPDECVPPFWFTFIIILRIFSPLSDHWSWTRQKWSRDIIHGMRFARSSTGKSNRYYAV